MSHPYKAGSATSRPCAIGSIQKAFMWFASALLAAPSLLFLGQISPWTPGSGCPVSREKTNCRSWRKTVCTENAAIGGEPLNCLFASTRVLSRPRTTIGAFCIIRNGFQTIRRAHLGRG